VSAPGSGARRPLLLVAYYLFAALAWFAIGFRGGAAAQSFGVELRQIALKGVVWVVPATLLAHFAFHEQVGQALGLTPADRPRRTIRAISVALAFLMLTTAVEAALNGHPPQLTGIVITAVVLELANAFVEEVAFRGFLLGQLARNGPLWRANLVATVLFVVVHWPTWFARGMRVEVIPVSVALALLALVLGAVTRWSGSVWLAIAAHALNNLTADR
jgi:membrane protease YdiL (CAAX protease family)